ncbi:hypothetical protein [Limnovirga soli]|uniref:Uncharacterized protein n=1 Tax=Limnovirga soli TaxID=2656915 RepID=A0A8J8FIB9_9BACT|nr:hypothetical protein [Limnovirga soli]NNV57142.1 hypothetical protein [Limnovirga soli]
MITIVDSFKLARQKALSDQALKLSLTQLNKGVDSFEMRIWVGSMFVEHDLILLKYSDTSWQTQRIRYFKSEDGVMHFKNENVVKPTITLPLLIDSLKIFQIEKLISQEQIPNFVDNVADGVTYNLEIATKGSYKLLTYHCPEHYSKTEINNKKFLDLILLVDKYFHFWSPICSI